MRTLKFCSIVILAIAMGFAYTSCGDDESDGKTPEGVVSNLKDVVGVDDANYVQGQIPQVTNSTTQVTTNSNASALAGGANIITVTSPVELKKFYLSIDGMDGYYEITPTPVTRITRVDAYVYEFTMNYSTNLDHNVTIVINAETVDGEIVSVAKQEVEYVESKSGDLAINLVFDQEKDVDLHLLLPEGSEVDHIYYANRGFFAGTEEDIEAFYQKEDQIWKSLLEKYGYPYDTSDDEIEDENFWIDYEEAVAALEADYAKMYVGLDHDSNAACDIDGLNNENIVLTADKLIPGEYKVYLNMWENCTVTEAPTKWTVITRFLDNEITAIEGKNPAAGEFAGNAESNQDDYIEKMTLVTTFTLTEAQINQAKSQTRAAATMKYARLTPNMKAIMKAIEGGSWNNMRHRRILSN